MKRAPLAIAMLVLATAAVRPGARTDASGHRPVTRLVTESRGTVVASLLGDDEVRRSERERVRRALRENSSGTYMSEMLASRDSALARWPDRRDDPIRVWIAPASAIADWTPGLVEAVRSAFLAWDAVELPARFTFVQDSADAEVTVGWIDRFTQSISGRTRWARDDRWWITDASITLAVHHHQGETLAPDAMHAMALHEIGHMLGLDHTTDSGCVMAPRVRVRELSAADRATVRLLYSLPPGEVR